MKENGEKNKSTQRHTSHLSLTLLIDQRCFERNSICLEMMMLVKSL